MISEALKEKLNSCFGCANPRCSAGCPLNMEIPQIIKLIKANDLELAYKKILEKSYFESVCSRVCYHDKQCEGSCVRNVTSTPVNISQIEKFISDWGIENVKEEMPDITLSKIAVVGSGPSGLTCAIELRKKGYDVTVFEREEKLGGILRFGIPEYRLPNEIVDKVINNILQYGIKVETGKTYGIDFNLKDLQNQNFKAVFLGIGNDVPKMLQIPGIDKSGVYGANEFLKNIDEIEFKKVIVVGGGNVAMDAARMAKLKGAEEVTVIYRRTRDLMKANKNEIECAENEGIKFKFENLPSEIVGNERVQEVICSDNEKIEADTIIMAIGSLPNYKQIGAEIKLSDDELINVNEDGETNIEGVFAGGDLVQSRATVCLAVKTAKIAAEGIHKKLNNTNIGGN